MSRGTMTFFFDAASCSGCKACEVACMDRHGLALGGSWRRVSEVSGGGWERDGGGWRSTVFAYHLSISCNHCERPICLEGCPTRAITRRDDGIVLIEADRCMGCGYCGWVCPYGAPQYQADRGVMTKCSFCVEDLDAGFQPACVTACPVRALDAGESDRLAGRHGANGAAVDPAPLPARELTEPALLLAPHTEASRSGEPDVDLAPRPTRGLREWALVLFTVLGQAAAGLTLFGAGLRTWLDRSGATQPLDRVVLPLVLGLLATALFVSWLHLGRKRNAIRALMNLRSSWLSREVLAAVALLGLTALAWWATMSIERSAIGVWAGWVSVPVAALLLFAMARVYMQRTIPVWNHRRTALAFTSTTVLIGGLTANLVLWTTGSLTFEQTRAAGLLILTICVVAIGRVPRSLAGVVSAAATLGLVVLLLIRPEPIASATPTILSWLALGLALVDQISRRRDYFARYERLGI